MTVVVETHRLPPPISEVWEWQLRGACRNADNALFFHPDRERGANRARRESHAKAICRVCPVVAECRAHALSVREPYGIWGGLSTTERDRIAGLAELRAAENGGMDEDVRGYLDRIPPLHRPLFDRLHRLILEAHPEAAVVISYTMPTYRLGDRRLHVGAWKHGASLYGWKQGGDAGFVSRHPALISGKRTIRLRPEDAASISDDEFRALVWAALAPSQR